jgi:hypothetical protein
MPSLELWIVGVQYGTDHMIFVYDDYDEALQQAYYLVAHNRNAEVYMWDALARCGQQGNRPGDPPNVKVGKRIEGEGR